MTTVTHYPNSANIVSSTLLAIGTLKSFFSFDTGSIAFVALAVFPTFFSEVLRKRGIFNPTANYVARQRSEKEARRFYQIATSYAFKQEVILFGLRDWILETWSEFKAESDKHRDPHDDVVTKALTASSMPENIIKDVLYVSIPTLDMYTTLTISLALSRPSSIFGEHHTGIVACDTDNHWYSIL